MIELIDECIKMKPKCKGSMEIDQKTKHVNDEDFFVVRMTMMGGCGEPYKQSDHQYGESYRLFPHLSIICNPNDGMF